MMVTQWQKLYVLLEFRQYRFKTLQRSPSRHVSTRSSKVIVGTKTVVSNGGIKTFVGAASLASPPKFYSVPLYVCTPTYKFSLMGCEEISHESSTSVIPEGTKFSPSVNTALTELDYVPPENVTGFITSK
ncbi:translation initiation factor eIF2B subunit beta-like [Scylla paramamosain]|uniref:translation initiation factor eIF2B subunit beta-like n=1 Tax=Scylla paramamosain TaxID=85552 RepID=UPI00308330AC